MRRRTFLALLAKTALVGVGGALIAAGRKPPPPYAVHLPDFMRDYISDDHIAYLNDTIPALFDEYRDLFPVLDAPPQYIVLNTLPDTLITHGSTVIAPDLLGDEALTLMDAQYLLVTMRFGSVATPHRGQDLDLFGRFIYLKQHPRTGYRTPESLLLEEIIHAQQDQTIMRAIIEREAHDPVTCLHAELKGISELGAHYYTDELRGELDYVFVLDDGTHTESAADAIHRLAARLNADDDTFLRAITYDADAYATLDAVAVADYDRHIWQMVTTWRHARSADGTATDIAPAFLPF